MCEQRIRLCAILLHKQIKKKQYGETKKQFEYNKGFGWYDEPEYGFRIDDCYDAEGYFDNDRLEDAIMDGEYVPEDW